MKSLAGAEETRHRSSRSDLDAFLLATTLAALAGFVDATGYIHFRHLFVSFMSGNSTQAAVAIAEGDASKFITLVRTIVCFVGGVAVGESLVLRSARWGQTLVLLLESALLGVALVSVTHDASVAWASAALAVAMGTQNAVVHEAEGISVALTYVTGTLVHVGRIVAKALRGDGSWMAAVPFVGLWVGLASGGLTGAVIAARSLTLALLLAAGASIVLLFWVAARAVIAPDAEP